MVTVSGCLSFQQHSSDIVHFLASEISIITLQTMEHKICLKFASSVISLPCSNCISVI